MIYSTALHVHTICISGILHSFLQIAFTLILRLSVLVCVDLVHLFSLFYSILLCDYRTVYLYVLIMNPRDGSNSEQL